MKLKQIIFIFLSFLTLLMSESVIEDTDNLKEIKALIKLQKIGDETVFLEKYFGEDYQKILENPQTYQNLKLKLLNNKKTTQELLKEKDELPKKINANGMNKGSVQEMITRAFQELRYDDAIELLNNFLESNQLLGDELVQAHYQKALIYIEEIEYFKAKDEFERYIPTDINDSEILSEYANIYFILAIYDKSLNLYSKVLKIQLNTLGKNHSLVAKSYHKIGLLYQLMGDYRKALSYQSKALRIQKLTLAKNHPDVAISYNNIGLIYQNIGEYTKALKYHQKALEVQLATLGKMHPDVAISYNNIGLTYQNIGEYTKALKYYQKALEIQLTTLGGNHSDVAISYNNIGLIYQNIDEYTKALKYYEKSLEIKIKTLGESHPDTANSYFYFAKFWEMKGIYNKAIGFYNKVLKIQTYTLGGEHPRTTITYASLATLYNTLGVSFSEKNNIKKH